MNKIKLKSNKGVSIPDVIIAIIILMMFVGVIGSLYYQILLNNNLIKMNAMAVYYTVKIAEDIDKMTYEEVTNDINTSLKDKYDILESYNATVEVQNYNQIDTSKQDIIKIVTINIEYTCFTETQSYKVQKLKIKEI